MPAYNAGPHIESVIERIPADVWPHVKGFWILNDGSRDDTLAKAEALAKRHAAIRVVHFETNRGYGGTVREGLIAARNAGVDFAVDLHSDGQYPPEYILPMVERAQTCGLDILQGSRHAGHGALQGGMPLYKYAAGKVLTALENRAFGLSLTDYHSGFICFSRRALHTVKFEQLSTSFDFDLEFIACARTAGLSIGELAIPTRYAGEVSYLNPVTYGLRVLRTVARYVTGHYRACIVPAEPKC